MNGSFFSSQLGKWCWRFWNTVLWASVTVWWDQLWLYHSLLVLEDSSVASAFWYNATAPSSLRTWRTSVRELIYFDLGISVRKELRRVPGLTRSCYRWESGDLKEGDIFHKLFASLFCGCQAEAGFKFATVPNPHLPGGCRGMIWYVAEM